MSKERERDGIDLVIEREASIVFPAAVMSWRQAAELNGDSCLTLSQILSSFGAPISEEQGNATLI